MGRPVVTEEGKVLQQELLRSLQGFSSDVVFGIVFYSAAPARFPANGEPVKATPASKSMASDFVNAMAPGRGSCPASALHETLNMANRSTVGKNMVVFLSSGGTGCPGFAAEQYAERTLLEVTGWNFKRLPIHSIVAGKEVNEDFPKRLAAMNNGTYKRISL